MKRMCLSIVLLLCLAVTAASADIPARLTYQGVLTNPDGTVVPDNAYSVRFRLYDQEAGGTALWDEAQSVTTVKGVFSAVLGKTTALDTLAFNRPYWLGLSVGAGTELTPRIALTASPYSLNSRAAGGGTITGVTPGAGLSGGGTAGVVTLSIGTGAIVNAMVQDGTLTGAKLQDGTLTGAKLQDGAVVNSKIAPGAVTGVQIADNSVTNADISPAAAILSTKILGDAAIRSVVLPDNRSVSTSFVNLGQITINAPSSGYVLLIFSGSSAAWSGACMYTDLALGTSPLSSDLLYQEITKVFGSSGDWMSIPFACPAVVTVAAGSQTYYASKRVYSACTDTTQGVFNLRLTAVFIPKSL